MKIESDLVSVILPVYNSERYVAEAIDSVLSQRSGPFELIVVDDGSSDRSGTIAKAYGDRLSYCRQENQGTAAARNAGIARARGGYLAFIDADDIWAEGRLLKQMQAFRAEPDLDIVSGFVRTFFSPELDDAFKQKIHCPEEPLSGHVVSAMLMRRASFDRIGMFDTSWQIGVDMSWYVRAREAAVNMKVLPDIVLHRRLHRQNSCLQKRDFISQRARILKASLDRRRGKIKEPNNGV